MHIPRNDLRNLLMKTELAIHSPRKSIVRQMPTLLSRPHMAHVRRIRIAANTTSQACIEGERTVSTFRCSYTP